MPHGFNAYLDRGRRHPNGVPICCDGSACSLCAFMRENEFDPRRPHEIVWLPKLNGYAFFYLPEP